MADTQTQPANREPFANRSSGRLYLHLDEFPAPLRITADFGPETELAPLADYFRLIRAQAAATREDSLGLAPRPIVHGTTDFVLSRALQGKTLAAAMRNIADAYNALHAGDYNFIEMSDRSIIFRIADNGFPYKHAADRSIAAMLECALIHVHCALSAMSGIDLTSRLCSIATRRPERAEHDPLNFWPCPIQYGAPWYAITYAPEIAYLPILHTRLSEADVYAQIFKQIEQREMALEPAFAPLVRQTLLEGARDQDDAAQRIGVSVATLRRRLAAEGLSFRALRQDHLNEAAKLGLLQTASIADVAASLGFSDVRAFTRAFKAWNGLSPRAFQDRARLGT